MKNAGACSQMTSSQTDCRAWSDSGAPTGTARITLLAPSCLATWHAALAVEPVAIPSSTTIAIRPAMSMCGRPSLNRCACLSRSARSRRSTAAISCGVIAPRRMTSSLLTRMPPSPIAPMASSGW